MKSADSRVRLVQSGLYLFWFGTRTRTSSSNATFWFGSWSWLTLRVNRLLFTLIFHCKSSHPIITPHSSEHTMSTKGPGVWTADHQVGAQPQALQRDIKVQRLFSFCFTCSEWDRDPTLLEHGQKILDWEQRRRRQIQRWSVWVWILRSSQGEKCCSDQCFPNTNVLKV